MGQEKILRIFCRPKASSLFEILEVMLCMLKNTFSSKLKNSLSFFEFLNCLKTIHSSNGDVYKTVRNKVYCKNFVQLSLKVKNKT